MYFIYNKNFSIKNSPCFFETRGVRINLAKLSRKLLDSVARALSALIALLIACSDNIIKHLL
jgi:hypothetical protein